jgi:hypothetical protein
VGVAAYGQCLLVLPGQSLKYGAVAAVAAEPVAVLLVSQAVAAVILEKL